MSYVRQIASAQRIIKKKGLLVTWNKHVVVTDSTKPWKTTPGVPQIYTAYIFLKSHSGGGLTALFHLMTGTEVPMGAPDAIMGAVPFTPELTDQVIAVIAGVTKTFVVKAIDIVMPDGNPILYKLQFE